MQALQKKKELDYGLQNGFISAEEYKELLQKIEPSSKASSSQIKELEMGRKKGYINEKEYNSLKEKLVASSEKKYKRGDSYLDFSKEEIENYDKRRQKRLDRLEKYPWFKKFYEFLDPTGNELAEQQQSIAKNVRNIATLPGTLGDLPLLPVNLGLMGLGKNTYVPSQMIGNAIDTATSDYTAPESNGEKVNEAIIQSVLPMGAISKGAAVIGQHGPQFLQKAANFLSKSNAVNPANVLATTGGAAASQEYINQNPDAGILGSLLAGSAGSLGGAKIGKNLNLAFNPSKWAAQKLDISKNKVQNQLKDSEGNYIPTTLADLSDSERLQRAQNVSENLPLIGKRIKKARTAGLEEERRNLNQNGLDQSLGTEGTGELALSGLENYENQIAKRDIENYRKITQGLEKHAVPYEPPTHVITKDGDIIPNKHTHFSDIKNKNSKLKEKIEYYTEEAIEDMAKKPINLVPFLNTKKFIGKQFSNIDHPLAQDNLFKEKFGKFVHQLDDIALSYNRKGVPYKSLQSIRSAIDDAVTTWGQNGNVTMDKLKQFRRAIHKDTSSYLEKIDPELKTQWDKANKLKSTYMNNELPVINEVKKVANKKTVEDVTNTFLTDLKNAGRKIHIAAKGLSEDKKKVLGYSLLDEMGQNSQGEFDLFTAANKYRQVKGGGKRALLSLFPDEKKKDIERMMRKIGDIQDTFKQGNPSGSGYSLSIFKLLKNPVKAAGALAANLPWVELYSNPKFINWVAKGAELVNEKDMLGHVKKLNKLHLGNNTLNQAVRSLSSSLQDMSSKEKEEKSYQKKK